MRDGLTVYNLENLRRKAAACDAALSYITSGGRADADHVTELRQILTVDLVSGPQKIVYLCGPINGCTDSECRDWREMAKGALGCPTLDPMRRDYRGREHEATREIVQGDKLDIRASDILLVNHPKPSVGTAMEILFAWEDGKTVVVVVPEGATISPWLKYHSTAIFHTFQEAIEHIRGLV